MLIRYATINDIPAWQKIADDLSKQNQQPNLANDSDFINYMHKKIENREALVAYDMIVNACMGVIAFSKTDNCISWLGVYSVFSRLGVETHLLKSVLSELDRTLEITVNAVFENEPSEESILNLYLKFGFEIPDDALQNAKEKDTCTLLLKPSELKPGNIIAEIHPSDFGLPDSTQNDLYEIRQAMRVVIRNDQNDIALIYVQQGHYYKLPGTLFEDDRIYLDQLKKQLLTQIGTNVQINRAIGTIKEYRDALEQIQITYGFEGKLIGEIKSVDSNYSKINPCFELLWVTLEQAIFLIESYTGDKYMGKYVSKRDATFLRSCL